jgi:hypothetical protein
VLITASRLATTSRAQKRSTVHPLVIPGSVLGSVQLDDDTVGQAGEVGQVGADRMLSAELHAQRLVAET